MDRVIFVRHGESESNIYGIISDDYNRFPLTERGREQAKWTSEQLRGLRFDGIISSPILRAFQTAEIIGKATGIEPVIDERAKESSFGMYNNRNIKDIPEKSREELNMEPWDSHIRRMLSLIADYSGSYIIVSHALPIKAIICHFLDLSEIESFSIEIKNASMSAVLLKDKKVLSVGSLLLSKRIIDAFSKVT